MSIHDLDRDRRYKYLLYCLHFLRCGTVSLLNLATGIRTQTISQWLRRLETEGFLKPLGYAEIDPNSGLGGRWWIPSRKDPSAFFCGDPLRANVRVLNGNDAANRRCIRFGQNTWFRSHELEAALAIARVMFHLRKMKLPGKTESETYLRTVRKWNGAPRTPAQHAHCHIISVPDVRVAGKDWAVNIEIESTIKSAKEYARYVENAEEGAIVLWLIQSKSAFERLASALSKAGDGRTKGRVFATWDKLEDALELSIKNARGIVKPLKNATDSSADT